MSLDAGWVTGYCCAALKPRELDDPGDAPRSLLSPADVGFESVPCSDPVFQTLS